MAETFVPKEVIGEAPKEELSSPKEETLEVPHASEKLPGVE